MRGPVEITWRTIFGAEGCTVVNARSLKEAVFIFLSDREMPYNVEIVDVHWKPIE